MLKSGANHVNCFIGTLEALSATNRTLCVAGGNAWNSIRYFSVLKFLTGLCIHQFLGTFAKFRKLLLAS
jgi:hypothetical protein